RSVAGYSWRPGPILHLGSGLDTAVPRRGRRWKSRDLYNLVMSGRVPSGLRCAADALALVTLAIDTSPVCPMFWNDPPLLFCAPQPRQVIDAGLLLLVKPQSAWCPPLPLLSNANRFEMTCTAETLLPPSLNPFPLLCDPDVVAPWLKAHELRT